MWFSDIIICMVNPHSRGHQITVKFNFYYVCEIKVETQLCLKFFDLDLEVSWLYPLSCCCADHPHLLNFMHSIAVRYSVFYIYMINQQIYIYKHIFK